MSAKGGGAAFPFLPILTLIFITLKLTDHIDWSWWLVLSPMLVPLALALVLAMIAGLCFGLVKLLDANAEGKSTSKSTIVSIRK